MKLFVIGFGVLGMFTMGCGLIQPAAAPVSTTTVTSAMLSDDALLPRSRPSTPADHADPWDGTVIEQPTWKSDHADPWEPPAQPESSPTPASAAAASNP